MAAAIKPLGDRGVIKPAIDQVQVRSGGIFIPETARESLTCFRTDSITEVPAKRSALTDSGMGDYD